jgi:hypothetical protein
MRSVCECERAVNFPPNFVSEEKQIRSRKPKILIIPAFNRSDAIERNFFARMGMEKNK